MIVWLLSQAARGRLAESLALEGGMPSVTWAGPRTHTTRTKQPVRVTIGYVTFRAVLKIQNQTPTTKPDTHLSNSIKVKSECLILFLNERISSITDGEGSRSCAAISL